MRPDQIHLIHTPSDPRLSPDGLHTAYVVSSPNLEDDRYDRIVWVDDTPLTSGPGGSSPRWSPDGTRLAFLHSQDDSPAQVAIINTDSDGEIETITDFELGVEEVEWSPDGSKLAVVAVSYTEEWADIDDDERTRRPRRIDTVPFRFDGKGWIHDRRRHIWLIDLESGSQPRCLTPGEFDETSITWSPDGSKLAFVSDRDPRRGLEPGNDVWELELSSGVTTQLTNRGFWSHLSYRRDGVLHLLGTTESLYPVNAFLHRLESDGSLTSLTGDLDRTSVSLAAGPPAIRWNGDSAIVGVEDSGRFGLIGVSPDGTADTLVDGDRVITGFDSIGDRIAFTASKWDSPGELYVDGEQTTHLNTTDLGLTEPAHFRVQSDEVEVDVWVLLPDGDEKVPLLLNIHGGPASQYGFGFFDEFQVYAGAGYGVVACNPRGSSGRGVAYTDAVKADGWGVVDLADIRTAVEGAIERFPRLDTDRMGVMGGSYGGFMTAWMIGQEDRWKSAVVERALLSWTSFLGTSDIGDVFPESYLEVTYPDGWERFWEASPLSLAHEVTTPTLILHSENDYRCPIEQAEQYFMALLRNGTTTEFLRFPGEGHEMSRSGKPLHRKERFEAILDWHSRHLI